MHIQEFREDYSIIAAFLDSLQEYIISIDPLGFNKKDDLYSKTHTKELLKMVEKNEGEIFVAYHDQTPIGMIAGIIEHTSESELLEWKIKKSGRVVELFVDPQYRGMNTGSALMEALEHYFKNQHCQVVLLDVFEPNTAAKHFYEHHGYIPRSALMMKVLSGV